MDKPLSTDARPVAQNLFASLIWWLITLGGTAVSSYLAANSAYLHGLPAYKAVPIGALTFLIIAFAIYWLTRARVNWVYKTASPSVTGPAAIADTKETERLREKIDELHVELHTERKSSRETIERLRGERDDLRQQNEKLSKDLTRVRESRAEWQVKYQKANNGALEASGDRDNLKLQLLTANIERNALNEQLQQAQRDLKQANLRANQEEGQRDIWMKNANEAERQLGDLRWLEGRMKQQAENLDIWVRIKKANRVNLQLSTTPRRVIIAFWVKNNSIFTITFNFKFLDGRLRFKGSPLHDPIRPSKRSIPIQDLEPGACLEIILVQPLLRTEAETIQDARQTGDPNAIFSLADLSIPFFVRNIPQEVAAAKLKIHSEIEFMEASEFPCDKNVDELDIRNTIISS